MAYDLNSFTCHDFDVDAAARPAGAYEVSTGTFSGGELMLR